MKSDLNRKLDLEKKVYNDKISLVASTDQTLRCPQLFTIVCLADQDSRSEHSKVWNARIEHNI